MYNNCPDGASCNWCCPRHLNHHGNECSWNCATHGELKSQILYRGKWNTQSTGKAFDLEQFVLGIFSLPFLLVGIAVVLIALFTIKHSVWVISFPFFRWEEYQPFDRFLSIVLVHLKASFSGGALLHHFVEFLGLGNWRYVLIPFGVALNVWTVLSTLCLPLILLWLWRARRKCQPLKGEEKQLLWIVGMGILVFLTVPFLRTDGYFAIPLTIFHLIAILPAIWVIRITRSKSPAPQAQPLENKKLPMLMKLLVWTAVLSVVSWGCGFYFGFANHVATLGK